MLNEVPGSGKQSSQLTIFIILGNLAILLAAIACLNHRNLFTRFFGPVRPELVVLFAASIGLVLFWMLMRGTPFCILQQNPAKGILRSVLIALPFGAVIAVIDFFAPFPANINLPFPVALLMYPSLGFVAEILFHILPLTLLVLLLKSFCKRTGLEKIMTLSILITAFLESIYHMVNMSGTVQFSNWILLLVGFHILLISLCQLLIFRRYDFISMYTFRMAYYLVWHVAWGTFRLTILFN